uniref:Uncharacterized protein n=1 Tax=Globisporangium ultimum (strain ATCC 200006 / CBS 805.95 / DAOM BR144) TaxID=431595 RepID=K3X0V9_GLOUD
MMFATMTECQENYWRGLVHGLLLMLPFVALTYRRTWQQQKPAEETKAPPVLGTFLNELFTFEVVLVAGAEMKAVKDQLQAAEQEGNAKRIEALKGRLLDVARVLEQKLAAMMPIIHFLTEQSINCITQNSTLESEEDEAKKEK